MTTATTKPKPILTPRTTTIHRSAMRTARERQGMSLRDLAARTGIHFTILGRAERDGYISVENAKRVAKELGVDGGKLWKWGRKDKNERKEPAE